MAVVLECPLEWYFGGTGNSATRILAIFKDFGLIVELMIPTLTYAGHFFLSPE